MRFYIVNTIRTVTKVSLQNEYSCLLQDAESYLWLYIIHLNSFVKEFCKYLMNQVSGFV